MGYRNTLNENAKQKRTKRNLSDKFVAHGITRNSKPAKYVKPKEHTNWDEAMADPHFR